VKKPTVPFRRLDTLVKRFGPAREVSYEDAARVTAQDRLVTILDVDGRLVGVKGWARINRFTYVLFERPIPDEFCNADSEIRGIWFSSFTQLP
jgi:hypothetical protein